MDFFPQPVLSILEFVFKDVARVFQQVSPERELWDASIEYIWTIPGCSAIYWGILGGKPDTVLCFIQWELTKSWATFETSLGFGLIAGLLTKDPFNHSLFLQTRDLSPASSILEAYSFALGANGLLSSKLAIESEWNVLVDKVQSDNHGECYSQWLEGQGPAEQVYIGLIVWDKYEFRKQSNDTNFENIRRGATSVVSIELIKEERKMVPTQLSKNSSPISTASLMDLHPARKYQDETELLEKFTEAAKSADRSIKGQWTNSPQYLPPQGNYTPMGQLNIKPLNNPIPAHRDRPAVVDVIWLTFTRGLTINPFFLPDHSQDDKLLFELRMELGKQSGCEALLWGLDQENKSKVAIMDQYV